MELLNCQVIEGYDQHNNTSQLENNGKCEETQKETENTLTVKKCTKR